MLFTFTFLLIITIVFLIYYLKKHTNKGGLFTFPKISIIKNLTTTESLPIHVYVSLCDYFKPFSGNVSQEIAEHRVVTWCKEYTRLSKNHVDTFGRNPIHTFFYSGEDYNTQLLNVLYRLYRDNLADIEIMLQNSNESAENFKHKIEDFRDVLFHHHGYLRKDISGKIAYGFMHDDRSMFGSLNTTQIMDYLKKSTTLLETGCFADFTHFSKRFQTNFFKQISSGNIDNIRGNIDSIFPNEWTLNNLLLIQSPNIVNWNARKLGIWPFSESGELSALHKFFPFRLNLWLQNCIKIETSELHLFIKLHTSGSLDQNIHYLLGENGLSQMWTHLEKTCISNNFVLKYVSGWEMYTEINALCLQNHTKNNNNSTTL